ncbi:MAG: DUF362 domain-containing protein [bacterium]
MKPHGRTLLKPNVVASGEHFPHAYTRPEFVEGVLKALKDEDGGMSELAVGERCGITMPTRFAYKNAGYYPMAERAGAKLYHFEEETQVEIPLYHKDRLRDCSLPRNQGKQTFSSIAPSSRPILDHRYLQFGRTSVSKMTGTFDRPRPQTQRESR